MAALVLWLGLSLSTLRVAAQSCANASTLVADDESAAVVYDAACNARSFQVVVSSTVERSLNLSNLDVVAVRSYPRVYQLYDISHVWVGVSCGIWEESADVLVVVIVVVVIVVVIVVVVIVVVIVVVVVVPLGS